MARNPKAESAPKLEAKPPADARGEVSGKPEAKSGPEREPLRYRPAAEVLLVALGDLLLAAGQSLTGRKGKKKMAATWHNVIIPAGRTESDHIPIPEDQLSAPPGKVTSGGEKLKGKARPRFDIQPDGAGCKIVLDKAHDVDLVIPVKRETDE